jgi:hypothetical protein
MYSLPLRNMRVNAGNRQTHISFVELGRTLKETGKYLQ